MPPVSARPSWRSIDSAAPDTPAETARYHSGPAPAARTLLDVLDATVAAHPDQPALDDGEQVLSYAQLAARTARTAAVLRAAGIGPGDRVGIRIESGGVDLYLGILSVLSAGAAYVPVDAEDPEARAELVWAEAGVSAVLGPGLVPALRPGVTPGGRGGRPGLDDDAWTIFTSGSTGTPKGVAVSHRAAAAFVDAEAGLFLTERPLGPGDRVLAGLSVAFDASCEEMWLAWRSGACLVPAARQLVRSGADLGPWLLARGVTAVSTVPTLAALWPPRTLAGVRLLIFGGEACPPELAERLVAPGREVWNTYGPTEATVVASAARLTGEGPVRIGLPLTGWELAVVDPTDPAAGPVAWGQVGELVIGGVGLARYLDPVRDAERFAPLPALGWSRAYRSGDLVRADPAGLVFVGRADDQVKLGGRRIELGEVDAALRALPGVGAAAAAVRTSPTGTPLLVGYLVEDRPGALEATTALAALRERLPAALVPLLATVDTLPVRTSGKVDRDALPWPLPTLQAQRPETATPVTADTTGWLRERYAEVLGALPEPEDDFFDSGGSSVTAAHLVSAVRRRHPAVSVADVYQHPTPVALAVVLENLENVENTAATDPVLPAEPTRPTPRLAGAVQLAVLTLLYGVSGLRWLALVGLATNVAHWFGQASWAPAVDWWFVGTVWLLLVSAPGRTFSAVLLVRLVRGRLRPGAYPRGGLVHLRLWTAERVAATLGVATLAGTPWAPRLARALGCRVGRRVALHTLPTLTGLAEYGDGCVVEAGADVAGWWLDGDLLRLGRIRVEAHARVATRATLLPGAEVGRYAEVEPGSGVVGRVADSERWAGTPARSVGQVGWPRPHTGRSRFWSAAYTLALALLPGLALLAAVPGYTLLLWALAGQTSLTGALPALAVTVPVSVLAGLLGYALLLAGLVRLLGLALRPGLYPASGRQAWCAWLTDRLVDSARRSLFPLYASLATPLWLRLLGARVGRHVEASTVTTLPTLARVEDAAFLADDMQLAHHELGRGWLRLAPSRVGVRAFVGNSGIVAAGRDVPDRALVGVLSAAPEAMEPGSSWLGQPAIRLPRTPEPVDEARTFAPPRRLVLARALVEACRVVPVLLAGFLGLAAFTVSQTALATGGLLVAAAAGGPTLLACGVLACLLTTMAKWLLVGRFRRGRHPLWSGFVWRNELYDNFVEELAVPWLAGAAFGTPLLNLWFRSLGARIGRGVWCETYWLPEPDLVELGAGASVNRGTVLQTHLFHDRLMRLDRVRLAAGSTLGPHAVVLPGAEVGADTTVGPASLVMAGERVPAASRWLGNPVAAWPAAQAVARAPRPRRSLRSEPLVMAPAVR